VSDRIGFTKMSGAGNDFIVLGPEQITGLGDDLAGWIRRICRRRLSVGADGLLLVEPAGDNRVKVRFHNPDGSQAFCANGSRCAARYAFLRGLAGESMILETMAGELPAKIIEQRVRLVLPAPVDLGERDLALPEGRLQGRYILAGAPHFVSWTESLSSAALERLGPVVRRHPEFGAAGVNLDLIRRRLDGSLGIRTWERGVEGETLSCGSGAVAAALAARQAGGGETTMIVPASGIPLEVRLQEGQATLEGDARLIFDGELTAEAVSFLP
jgi:diaminopimelate epimerase